MKTNLQQIIFHKLNILNILNTLTKGKSNENQKGNKTITNES